MLINKNIVFIGTGRMASALIIHLIKNKQYSDSKIIATHRCVDKIMHLKNNFGIYISDSNVESVIKSDIIILSARPEQIQEVVKEIKNVVQKNQIIISLAIGVPLKWLHSEFPNNDFIYHVHPPSTIFASTPGISFITSERKELDSNLDIVINLFKSFGETILVSEEDLEKYAVYAGASPAFFLRLAENWLGLAVENGISREVALKIIYINYKAIINSITDKKLSFKDIEKLIATPNGVTEMGLSVIDKNNLEYIFIEIVKKAQGKIKMIKSSFFLT
jgi:pyrroline-5-carboxylate reductase